MIAYNDKMSEVIMGLNSGKLRQPDFFNNINPPSLWAYFSTLPTWARNHPYIRNVFMGMEYHKPGLTIRQKELALNFAVSFIRPIDKKLENVIVDIAASNKIRLNIALGKEAVNSLKFYDFDNELLGTTTETEDPPSADEEDI